MEQVKRVIIREVVETMLEYTHIICSEVDKPNEFMWLVRVPNWESPHEPHINEIGYIKFEIVEAGKSLWYADGKFTPYDYNQVYFKAFIRDSRVN